MRKGRKKREKKNASKIGDKSEGLSGSFAKSKQLFVRMS